MTEEEITKKILSRLKQSGWNIICFDFPQSGTGYVLQIDNNLRTNKGQDSIIPDIVALKDGKCVFFENKNRFVLSDFEKINKLKTTDNYSKSIDKLLSQYSVQEIFYGIGLPLYNYPHQKAKEYLYLVDFVVGVSYNEDICNVEIIYQSNDVF